MGGMIDNKILQGAFTRRGWNIAKILSVFSLMGDFFRFDLSKRFMLENRVMKDMGKKGQEEEKWPII